MLWAKPRFHNEVQNNSEMSYTTLSLCLMNHFYFCAVNFPFLLNVQTTVNATHLE